MAEYLETTVDKFRFRVAADRRYHPSGVWVLEVGPGRVRLGVSDFLQQHSGDAAFVTVKAAGTRLAVDDDFADLETIKVNLALAAPVAGTIAAVNAELALQPELVNQSPYDRGWLAEIEVVGWEEARAALLDAPAYLAHMKAEAEAEARR